MQVFVLGVLCLAIAQAGERCVLKTDFGDNACDIGGSMEITSVPNGIVINKENCNLFVKKEEFKKQPLVSYAEALPTETYTLVMVDPDAPDHAKGRYYLHWIAANIGGQDLQIGNLSSAMTVAAYKGPTPPEDTGTHRYMFMLFVFLWTEGKLQHEISEKERCQFNLHDYLEGYFKGPVAGSQIRTNFLGREPR